MIKWHKIYHFSFVFTSWCLNQATETQENNWTTRYLRLRRAQEETKRSSIQVDISTSEEDLRSLFSKYDLPWNDPRDRNMTIFELQKMATSPLVTIGAHTDSHPYLSKISAEQQAKEILISKMKLEAWLSPSKVNFFAYPFGDYLNLTPSTEELLRKNFQLSFSVDQKSILHAQNFSHLHVPRFLIGNDDEKKFKRQLTKMFGTFQ